MATIQIADKPTLDAVKSMLSGSASVQGYPNISVGEIAPRTLFSVTGTGVISLSQSTGCYIYLLEIDGVVLVDCKNNSNHNYVSSYTIGELYFQRSFKVNVYNTSTSTTIAAKYVLKLKD